MLKKILTIFRGKKKRYKDKVKREKSTQYLLKEFQSKASKKKGTRFTSMKKQRAGNQLSLNIQLNKRVMRGFYIIVLISLCLTVVYVFKGEYFNIAKIEIYSDDGLSNIDLSYKAVEGIRGRNIFLTHSSDIKDSLLVYQENLQSISLSKKFPDTLIIDITSFPAVLRTTIGLRTYIITSNGVAVPQNLELSTKKLTEIRINNLVMKGRIDYKKIVSPQVVQNIYRITQKFSTNLLDLSISNVLYFSSERELHIELEDKTMILFDLFGDIDEQIKKMAIFHKDYGTSQNVYIDLRIKNKIYYCEAERESQCRKNLARIYNTQ